MDRSIFSKVAELLVLLAWLALILAPPSTDAGTFAGFPGGGAVGGFAGFPGGGAVGGFGGLGGFPGGGAFGGTGGFPGGGIFGGDGGSTTSVPQPSSLLLTVIGLGVAAWGAWRNRR
jgi:hypothetical protein